MPVFLIGVADGEGEVVDEEDLEEDSVVDGWGVLVVGFIALVDWELLEAVNVFVEITLDLMVLLVVLQVGLIFLLVHKDEAE